MDIPDRITHSMVNGARPGRARLRSWKDGKVTSVIETSLRWDRGTFDVSDYDSVVHPDCRGHAEAVLVKVASLTGLDPRRGLVGDLEGHGACRVVDEGRIVVWARHGNGCVIGHARELGPRGPVVRTSWPFGKQVDSDGVTWMTVGFGIISPFPRRGAIKAMYDMVEQASGIEMRPMGWNGMGGSLNDERVYTLWRKRLALRGIDVDEGLRPDTLARTRELMSSKRRDELDQWVRDAIEQFESDMGAPAP